MQHTDPDDDGNLTCWICHHVGEPSSFQSFTQKERMGHFRVARITYYFCRNAPECFSRAQRIRLTEEMKGEI